ncbi:unnamed protein product [Ceratitis capitata]|uniref:(Mediterranean fruit fly) hypothetical protein n=1 Tax=Ceratitis capitata TaxID=7213 RepID=A0A811U0Y8_CERCA|nr:unnamed protein product [Ceratitis capitata]
MWCSYLTYFLWRAPRTDCDRLALKTDNPLSLCESKNSLLESLGSSEMFVENRKYKKKFPEILIYESIYIKFGSNAAFCNNTRSVSSADHFECWTDQHHKL